MSALNHEIYCQHCGRKWEPLGHLSDHQLKTMYRLYIAPDGCLKIGPEMVAALKVGPYYLVQTTGISGIYEISRYGAGMIEERERWLSCQPTNKE